MDTILTLRQKFEELRAAAQERRDRIEAAYREENSDVPPTRDCNGRYHAPCDGYMIPGDLLDTVEYRGCYDDHVFGAGEYLPVPLSADDDYFGGYNSMFSVACQRKAKALVSVVVELQTLGPELGLRVSHGKTWDQDGQVVAIAYVSGIRAMVDAAVEALELPVKPREEEPEVYLPAGRHQVEGEVVHVKVEEGYYGTTRKMLVKTAQGHKLWGSLPGAMDTEFRGWISFSAQFEPGKNGMTWFKRPTKVTF